MISRKAQVGIEKLLVRGSPMKTIDFARSFLTFRIDAAKKEPITVSHKTPFSLNNARISIECRCEITDKQTRQSEEFVLGANCKAEQVGVERDIWHQPNADFVPIFSRDRFLTLKTYDRADRKVMLYPPSRGEQPHRLTGRTAEAFDSVRIDLCHCEGTTLETADQIVDAVLENRRLVARTEIENENYVALIEYPIKTMNANERDKIYQPDTGPVILPDLSRKSEDMISGLELAFVAFNTPNWAEFLVRVATPIAEGISVFHYARSVRCDTRNEVVRLSA
jgi:hypothetical protein